MSESVPICSTEPELKPSMPTQKADHEFSLLLLAVTAGTIQDPETEVTELSEPFTT